jgi:predicted SAM-dependent methyltransferase
MSAILEMSSRAERILEGIDLDKMIGLEIGPLANPLVPRHPGRSIYYLDYATRSDLQKKSAHDPHVNVENIPEIDFVVRGVDEYSTILVRFDYIVASHVVEHVPDFLGWIEALLNLLNPGGRLILAVPDKRYTFDYFRPPSTLGDALEAYFEKRRRPSFRQVFDGHGMARRVDTVDAWGGEISEEVGYYFEKSTVLALAKGALFNGDYSDCHCWVFTYQSFLGIIRSVNDLGILRIEVVASVPPRRGENEFLVTLACSSLEL